MFGITGSSPYTEANVSDGVMGRGRDVVEGGGQPRVVDRVGERVCLVCGNLLVLL